MQSNHHTFLCLCVSLRVGDVFEGGAGGGEKACALRKELVDLERAERSLDELIQSSTKQLKQLTEYKDSQRYPLHAISVFNHIPASTLLCLVTHANIHLTSVAVVTPWLHTAHWAMWRTRTSAPSAVYGTRQSSLSRPLLRPSWRCQTQQGWEFIFAWILLCSCFLPLTSFTFWATALQCTFPVMCRCCCQMDESLLKFIFKFLN